MNSDTHLRRFVSSRLQDLIGLSEKYLVEYLINIARNAKSSSSILAKLQEASISDSTESRLFARELFERASGSGTGTSTSSSSKSLKSSKKGVNEQQLACTEQSYGFIQSSESEKDGGEKKSERKKSRRKKVPRSTRKRELSSSEDEETVERRRKRLRGDLQGAETEQTDAMDELDAVERERLQDIRERDEFAARLREKDREKDRHEGNEEGKVKLSESKLQGALPELRERSRQTYLQLREKQKLMLLRRQIDDEEFLFGKEQLTRKERKKLEYDKEVLRLAEERLRIENKTEGYHLPDDYITERGKIDKKKREAALYKRYEDNDQADFVTESDRWEKLQIERAKQAAEAEGRGGKDQDFDYLFDAEEQVNFILETTIDDGDEHASEKPPKMSAEQVRSQSIAEVRKSLPIYPYRESLLEAIEEFSTIIIVGETGSGKSTQIPQYLYEAGYCEDGKKIGITQPRRVAAMSLCSRVSEEMNDKVGYKVGYSIRFEDCTSDKTRIKYMTDGMLLREFLTEPDLKAYSAIIIDEAHERTLHTDVVFGLVKDIARYRQDLKILISSATVDAEKFAEFFDSAPIFEIPGRKFPVDVYYTQAPEANYLTAAITAVMQIHISQGPGDILVFLTGQEEIETAQESLSATCRAISSKIKELIICPIYSTLPSDLQAKIFEPTPEGARKVVLATNIAETSITIDGVAFVIDPGFQKLKTYNPRTGMESLIVQPCSRASAVQRAGRAGRVGPGKCFRLYTKWSYENELEENTSPEIQRTNMGNVVLTLKSLGIHDLMDFDFMDPPPSECIIRALEQLYALGALNDRGELTKLGRRMAEFPIDPMMAKSLIASEEYECCNEILSIISMLSVQNAIFYRPRDKAVMADKARMGFFHKDGDHLTLLNVWNAWVETNYSIQWCYESFIQQRSMKRARDVREQLASLLERVEIEIAENPDPGDTVPIRKALTAGYFYNTCRLNRSGDSYKTLKQSQTVMIHPTSSLFRNPPKWCLYFELVLTTKEFMRQIVQIKPDWLWEVAPHVFQRRELEEMDTGGKYKRGMSRAAGMASTTKVS